LSIKICASQNKMRADNDGHFRHHLHAHYVRQKQPKTHISKRSVLEKTPKKLYTDCAQWQRFTLWFVGDDSLSSTLVMRCSNTS